MNIPDGSEAVRSVRALIVAGANRLDPEACRQVLAAVPDECEETCGGGWRMRLSRAASWRARRDGVTPARR